MPCSSCFRLQRLLAYEQGSLPQFKLSNFVYLRVVSLYQALVCNNFAKVSPTISASPETSAQAATMMAALNAPARAHLDFASAFTGSYDGDSDISEFLADLDSWFTAQPANAAMSDIFKTAIVIRALTGRARDAVADVSPDKDQSATRFRDYDGFADYLRTLFKVRNSKLKSLIAQENMRHTDDLEKHIADFNKHNRTSGSTDFDLQVRFHRSLSMQMQFALSRNIVEAKDLAELQNRARATQYIRF